jgi:hypothetical protein
MRFQTTKQKIIAGNCRSKGKYDLKSRQETEIKCEAVPGMFSDDLQQKFV